MTKLVAFNNDPQLKADLLAEVIKHREADAVIKGSYGDYDEETFKGCAVGCTLHSYAKIKDMRLDTADHKQYERFGIPKILARLQDNIFERLPASDSIVFPEQFLSAIPVGADLSTVWPKFAQFLMTDEIFGVINFTKLDQVKATIQKVSDLYRDGGSPEDFSEAAFAGYAAAASYDAAFAAAAAAAAAAAYDASAAGYDGYAASAAAQADAQAGCAAAYAAEAAHTGYKVHTAQAEHLIKLLAGAQP